MPFEEGFKNFILFVSRRQKKQSLDTLSNNFRKHILPYFKERNINDITVNDIIDWQNIILSKNFSNSFNNTLYVEFSTFFTFCCNYYSLHNNVVKQVGNFKKKQEIKKHDFYTYKEFKKFIKCVDNNIYKEFFNLMFFCGTRPGEAMALKFSDLQGNYISITKNLTIKGGRILDTPKNQSSIRLINIDYFLKKDLLKLQKFYIKIYKNPNYDYYLFGGIKPLSPTSINRIKFKACFKANIRPIKLHEFRHSHATLLLTKGVPINEISRRLGHSKISTTFDVYVRNNQKQEKRVVNTLNSLRFDIFRFF